MSRYTGYNQRGFANSTVAITRAASGNTTSINYSGVGSTTLYLPFDDDVNDDSPLSQTITNRGSMTVDSTYAKFGSKSLKSETSGSLKIDNSASTDLDGSFTIEFFLYVVTHENSKTVYTHNDLNGTFAGALFWFSGGVLRLYASSNGSNWNILNNSALGSISTDAWHHVAFTYDGSTYRAYVDGTRKWEVTSSTTLPTGGNHYIFSRTNAGQYRPSTGNQYLDDFRITKGVALYTGSTYTVPTSALGLYDNSPVSLYLPFDSDVNDDSPRSHTVTASGGAAISSTQAKFGGNSLALDGTNDYLDIPDNSFHFGSDDLTVECWLYHSRDSQSSQATFLDFRNSGSNGFSLTITENGYLGVYSAHTGNVITASSSTEMSKNAWHHFVYCRSGTTGKIFVDGLEIASATDNSNYASTSLRIGARYTGNVQYYVGYIDDLRIIKGVARYTKNFIPPNAAVGAVLTGANETNTTTDFTKLYLPFDSDLQDDSSSSHSVTATGGAAISSAQKKFGSNSALFDGTNDYISIPSSSDFNFDSDFTIECFIYPNNNNNYMLIAHRAGSVNFTLEMHRNSTGDIEFFAGSYSGSNPLVSTTINGGFTGAWHHVAVTRVGNIFRLFFDGELKNTATQSLTFNTSAELRIGADNHPSIGSRFFFNGYIDDFRIIKGYGKYTADFVPPTSAVGTSVSETVNDLTALYLPFDATVTSSSASGSTVLYLPLDSDTNDDSSQSQSVINSGVTISSTQAKFGSYSGYFDGSDYLQLSYAGGLGDDFVQGDFTMEAFIYPTSLSGTEKTIFSRWDANGSHRQFVLKLNTGGSLIFEFNNNSDTTSSGTVSTNEWTHVAVTRESNIIRLFINGTLTVTRSSISNPQTVNRYIDIGRREPGSQARYFVGYIDDVRFFKGTALYTSNFTVPTSALGTSPTVTTLQGGFEDLARNHGVTKNGDATLIAPVKKFGTSSAYFDGTGDYLTIPSNADFHYGADDFTIEMFVYMISNSSSSDPMSLISKWDDGQRSWAFELENNNKPRIRLSYDGSTKNVDTTLGTDVAPTASQWHHLAFVRSGETLTTYLDGTAGSTTIDLGTNSLASSTTSVYIGQRQTDDYFNGYIDDLRIIKGHAKYTANFTAPTSAHGHVSLEETTSTSENYSDSKFLSGVWSLQDQNKKISKGDWIRNDANSGSDAKGLTIIGANLETVGHRWYVTPPTGQPFFDPSLLQSSSILSNSNKTITNGAGSGRGANYILNSITSGKYYVELTIDSSGAKNEAASNNSLAVGVVNANHGAGTGLRGEDDSDAFGRRFGVYGPEGSDNINNGNIIGLALDADNNQLDIYVNNTLQSNMSGSFSVTGALFLAVSVYDGNSLTLVDIDSYTYTTPSGYETGWTLT